MSFSVSYAGLAESTTTPIDLKTTSPNGVGPNFFLTTLLDGSFMLGWNSNDGNGSGVFLQRLVIGLDENLEFDLIPLTSPFAPYRANTAVGGDQYRPRITPLFDGGFGVAWESYGQDGSAGGIYGQLFDITGNKVGIETRVNTIAAGNQMHPVVAPFADIQFSPGFGVLWTTGAGKVRIEPNSVYQGGALVGRGFDLQNGSYSADPDEVLWSFAEFSSFNEIPITTGATFPNDSQLVVGVELHYVATDGSGNEIPDSTEARLGLITFSDNGPPTVDDVLLQQDSDPATDSGEVRIVDLGDGNRVYVTWQEQTATQMTIYGRLYDITDGSTGPTQTLVSQALNGDQNHHHDIKLLDTGYLLLVWDDTTSNSIKGQWLFGADGTPGAAFSNQTALMTGSTELDAPRLTADDIGGAVLGAIEADGGVLAGGSGKLEFELVTLEEMIDNLNPIQVLNGFFEDTSGRAGRIEGGTGVDTINAGGGDDILVGGRGDDFLNGGTGDDIYWFQDAGDILSEAGGDGFDTVWAFFNSIILPSGLEEIIFKGDDPENPVDFFATGNDLDNTIIGGSGNDTIDGNAGDNVIDFGGGSGDTAVFTGSEDDVAILNIHLGNRAPFTLNGVSTGDIVAMTARNGRVDRMIGVEQVKIGGGAAQSVGQANVARDVTGDRYLTDENPNDDTTTITKGGAKRDILDLLDGDDTAEGLAGNDVLLGREGNDILRGQAGDDTLDGGVGNDVLEGGLGNDTYIMDIDVDSVTDTGGIDTLSTRLGVFSLADIAGVASIEKLTHVGDNDFAGTGNALANTITGGGGDDTLDGAGGADRMIGLGGDDTYVVNAAGDVVVEANGGGDNDRIRTSLLTQKLGKFVEHLERTDPGAAGKFVGTGNELDNRISGGVGADVLSGLDGNDTLSGLDGKDILIGGLGADSLDGGDGDDKLSGNDGNDRVDGGAGNDVLDAGTGDDTLVASDGNDTFTGGLGSDTLDLSGLGWSFASKGRAGGFAVKKVDPNTFTLTSGTQVLTVKGLFDAKTGDRGVETFKFVDNPAVGLDLVLANAMSNFGADNFGGSDEADVGIDGQGGDDTLDGAGGDDVLLGGLGRDLLIGGSGNDSLDGGAGDDTLRGGSGSDTMSGGAGNDIYELDDAGDVVSETLIAGGIDEIRTTLTSWTLDANVEKLSYTGIATTAFAGTGNGSANVISGRDGDDMLDGGSGADTLIGGLGSDAYVVDVSGDKIVEAVDAGVDSVTSRANVYTLAVNVENLVFDGTGKFVGTGNGIANSISGLAGDDVLNGLGGDDVLTGDAGNDTLNGGDQNDTLSGGDGNDVLNGGAGNDTLNGGAGIDKLTGGSGDDLFIFDTAPTDLADGVVAASIIAQFDAVLDLGATDKVQLDNAIFGALGADGALDPGLFSMSTVATRIKGGDQLQTVLVYEKATGLLFYDADGTGEGDSAHVIGRIVAGAGNTIDAGDFVVI